MKSKNIITYFFIVFFSYSCGFKPLLKNIDLTSLNISEISILGDEKLSFFFKNRFNIKENRISKDGNKIKIIISDSETIKTKNSSGIPIEEQVEVNINLEIYDYSNKLKLSDNFTTSKIVSITNNPSSDNQIKKNEKENIITDLMQQISFAIHSELLRK